MFTKTPFDSKKSKKTVFISGASSGLGFNIASKLAKLGHRVYGGYLSTAPPKNTAVSFIKCDITSDESVINAISEVLSKEKKIDILINCAGISPSDATLNFTSGMFAKTLETNVIGPFRLIKAVAEKMKGGGVIINISSLNGFLSLPHSGIYSASKFALEALGFALRLELKHQNIKVVNVAPGAFVKSVAKNEKKLKHVPAREKFPILKILLPFTREDQVADEVLKLISKEKYPPRVIIGIDAKITTLLLKVLPYSWFDKILTYIWQKNSLAFRL